MSKYIDADKLKAEIERRKEKWLAASRLIKKGKDKAMYAAGKSSAYTEFFSLITSLQQEQPEVDLEKEFSQEYATYHLPDFILGTLCDGTGVIDFIYKTARHFWNKGYNARKEE